MSKLLRRAARPGSAGALHVISPEDAAWTFVGFEVHRLDPGGSLHYRNAGCETCAVIVEGSAEFEIDGVSAGPPVERASPFAGPPSAFYASAGARWSISALTALEIAICRAPATQARPPLLIRPGDIVREMRGTGSNTRYVYDLLPDHRDEAEALLVVDAFTPGGSWSSYPPHKHDVDNPPTESKLEEVYYYRINPPTGFAFQRVYTDDRRLDETMTTLDRDVVLVPCGYHPVGAPHGYDVYYLNVMAGPRRIWRVQTDPDHRWMLERAG